MSHYSLTTSESHTVLVTLQQNTESAVDKITQKLQDLEVVLKYLERTSKASEEATAVAKEEQAKLAEQLRACDENMSASQNSATQKELKTIDQEWGDTTLKNGANMQGSTEENANVHQKWRNTSIEDGFNVQGKHSTRDIEALERVESTHQQRGPPTTMQFQGGAHVWTQTPPMNHQEMPQQPMQWQGTYAQGPPDQRSPQQPMQSPPLHPHQLAAPQKLVPWDTSQPSTNQNGQFPVAAVVTPAAQWCRPPAATVRRRCRSV